MLLKGSLGCKRMTNVEKPLKPHDFANINCLNRYKEYWLKDKNPQRLINAINYCKQEHVLMPDWLQLELINSFSSVTFNNRGEFILGKPFSKKDYSKQNILKHQTQQLVAGIYAECLDAKLKVSDAILLTQYELYYAYNESPIKKGNHGIHGDNQDPTFYDETTIKKYYKNHLLHRRGMTVLLTDMLYLLCLHREPIGQVVYKEYTEWKNDTIKKRLFFYTYILMRIRS